MASTALPVPRPLHADRGARARRTPGRRARADQTPPGSRDAARRAHGARHRDRRAATIKGKPVRLHEAALDLHARGGLGASASQRLQQPGPDQERRATSSAPPTRSATRSTGSTSTTKNIAYFNSGNNPVRAEGTRPELPGARPQVRVARLQPRRTTAPLHAVRAAPAGDQPAATSRAGTTSRRAATARPTRNWGFTLGLPLEAARRPDQARASAARRKMTLLELIDAMEDGGTIDLRGAEVLPYVLTRARARQKDPRVRDAVGKLRAWAAAGAHRRDRDTRRRLRARRGGADHGRLVAAAGCGRSSSRRWARTLYERLERRHRPRQRAEQPRRAPGLGLPGRLVRLRDRRTCARCSAQRVRFSNLTAQDQTDAGAALLGCKKRHKEIARAGDSRPFILNTVISRKLPLFFHLICTPPPVSIAASTALRARLIKSCSN